MSVTDKWFTTTKATKGTKGTTSPRKPESTKVYSDHEFRGIQAQLEDGRVAELELRDGKLEIVRIIVPSESPKSSEPEAPMMTLSSPTGWVSIPGTGAPLDDDEEEDEDTHEETKARAIATSHDPVFKAQLESVMNDNKFDRKLRGRTKGKLDMTRLYKGAAGASSVFTRKQSRRGKQYNVVLVVDESGSMADLGKSATAGEAVQFLARHFDQISGVNLAIIGFNRFIQPHKSFEKIKGAKETVDLTKLKETIMLRARGNGAGENNDFEALVTAYDLLKGREGTNLVLFLSDGAPASSQGSYARMEQRFGRFIAINEPDQLQALVTANKLVATTIGIGIKSTPNQTPQWVRVDNLSELKPKILTILRQQIKRG